MSRHLEVLQFLKNHGLFVGFTDEQITHILPYIRREKFSPGEWILKEGDEKREICFFLSGRAESLMHDENEYHCIEVFEAGHWSDSNAFLENKKRMASLRALEETEVIIISLQKLKPLLEKMGLYSQFIGNLSGEVCDLLRENYERHLHAVKEKTKMLRAHDQISKLIVHLFILISIYIYMLNLFNDYLKHIVIPEALTPFVIIGVAMSAAIFIKGSGYSLKFYGLTSKRWVRDSMEATLWSLPVMGLIVIIKWVLIRQVGAFAGIPLFQMTFERIWPHGDKYEFGELSLVISYFLLVPVQEFLTRGFLQTVFRDFFRGPSNVILSILVSNLLFGIFHGIRGISFSLAVFALGLFWGVLYEQQRSIVGVSVSHALLAIWALGFVGLSQILIY